MLEFFKELALYNRWANQRLYQSVAGLSSTLYRENRKAPFHSIHGTLNHLLVVDRLWLYRLTGKGTLPTKLDEILYGFQKSPGRSSPPGNVKSGND